MATTTGKKARREHGGNKQTLKRRTKRHSRYSEKHPKQSRYEKKRFPGRGP